MREVQEVTNLNYMTTGRFPAEYRVRSWFAVRFVSKNCWSLVRKTAPVTMIVGLLNESIGFMQIIIMNSKGPEQNILEQSHYKESEEW